MKYLTFILVLSTAASLTGGGEKERWSFSRTKQQYNFFGLPVDKEQKQKRRHSLKKACSFLWKILRESNND